MQSRYAAAAVPAELIQALAPFGSIAGWEALAPFSHVFTHFKLHVVPYRISLQRRADIAGQLPHVWYDTDRLAQAPLPAPVKKLLLQMFGDVA